MNKPSVSSSEPSLLSLIKLLSEYRVLWDREIIYEYPNYKAPFRDSWVSYLSGLESRDLYGFQLLKSYSSAPADLRDLCERIVESRALEVEPPHPEVLPLLAYQFMTEKKRHEINQLLGLLIRNNLLPSKNTVLDFCGGAGYLGRTLSSYFNSSVVSIDIDRNLQERGRIRAQALNKANSGAALEFVTADVLKDSKELCKKLPMHLNSIGIHTCAHLSDVQIELARILNPEWLFNVSCCYYKTDDTNYSFSKISKEAGFSLSKESLLLSARGHDLSFESFEFAMQVKSYRYMLHVFMKDFLGLDFVPMGGIRKNEYARPFSAYAKDRLKSVLNIEVTERELNHFKDRAENQLKVKEMIACNSLRVIFARLIEKYIALDRAVYLEELGYQVRVMEVFNQEVSPRNIGILASV